MTARRRRGLLTAAAVAAVAALTACAQPMPEPDPRPQVEDVPVVTGSQLDRVMTAVAEIVAAADQAGDAKALAPRVDGAELQLRQARYTIRAKVPKHPAPSPVGTERLLDVVPVDQPWPRYMFTVTEPTADAVPRIQLLTQPDARSPYRLSASATLLPGVTLPRTAPAETGVEALPADAPSDLLVSPNDALARYASVLTSGDASKHSGEFTQDAFRKAVVGEQDAERKAAGTTCKGCFSYQVTHTPRADSVWSVRTLDGGALVLGVLDTTRTFTVAAQGSKLPISADLAVLGGKNQATKSAAITSVQVVAMHVPAASSDEQLEVVAADRGPVKVTAS